MLMLMVVLLLLLLQLLLLLLLIAEHGAGRHFTAVVQILKVVLDVGGPIGDNDIASYVLHRFGAQHSIGTRAWTTGIAIAATSSSCSSSAVMIVMVQR